MNSVPQIHVCLEPQNATLFRNRISAGIISEGVRIGLGCWIVTEKGFQSRPQERVLESHTGKNLGQVHRVSESKFIKKVKEWQSSGVAYSPEYTYY